MNVQQSQNGVFKPQSRAMLEMQACFDPWFGRKADQPVQKALLDMETEFFAGSLRLAN
jgi:hypothetical protein